MVLGFLLGIVIAYILAFFNFDQTIIAGVKDIVKVDIGSHGYYFMLGVIGAISRLMIGGFLSGLFIAYLFTFIKLNHIIIDGLKEWFNYDLSSSGYYLLFAVIGALFSLINGVKTLFSPFSFLTGKKKNRW